MLEHVRVILVNPSHPGNIGAVARAMKNMALSSLYLVAPKHFPHQEATVRAAGADDILANASVVDTLEAAVADCHLVFGSSARTRQLSCPSCTPKECAKRVMQAIKHSTALVFGCESHGLSNKELALCHYHVRIPTAREFASLNLAAAVQVLVYELFIATTESSGFNSSLDSMPATMGQVSGFLQQLESVLFKIEFLDPKHPKLLLERLWRLFNRARLEDKEVHILRGILSKIEKKLLLLKKN